MSAQPDPMDAPGRGVVVQPLTHGKGASLQTRRVGLSDPDPDPDPTVASRAEQPGIYAPSVVKSWFTSWKA
jgi:hypothetical protein